MKKDFAFTLAEVLITLTIIGVIAAMVIPTLMQKHLEHEMISKLKKTYSVMNNAVMMAVRDNGPVDEWNISAETDAAAAENIYNYVAPYLKVTKVCGTSTGCFGSSYKTFMGYTAGWSGLNSSSSHYKIILDDGVSIGFYNKSGEGCKAQNNNYYKQTCGTLFVDLNNKKGPNKFGVDVFNFRITEKNVIPNGLKGLSYQGNCQFNNSHNTNGYDCAAHVIYKGDMDYLRHTINDNFN